MANFRRILILNLFVILPFWLVRGTVISDTFYLKDNQFNLTYSNFERLKNSSQSECCIQCLRNETCFAFVMNKTPNNCLLLLMENESDEICQLSVQPDSDIWFKHGDYDEMKFTTSVATTEATTEASTELFKEATAGPAMESTPETTTAASITTTPEATTSGTKKPTAEATTALTMTTTADCTEVFSCPNDFTFTCEGCFHFSESVVEWEAAERECSTMGQGVTLALTSTLEKLSTIVDLMDSLGIETAWIGAKDELADPDVWEVFDKNELWVNGQVDNSDGNCAVIYKDVGLLSIDQCYDSHLFVCEAVPEV